MSNLASPILVVPKKQNHMDSNNSQGSSNFNLQLCIDYRKLNSHIQTAHQIKANGTLDNVIYNYTLPTIDSILAHFNSCNYFSTIDLRSGYYHIKLSKGVAVRMAFITDKGKWFFHSLSFGINISPPAFTCVLGKVLVQYSRYALNYLDDIMVFSDTWESYLRHHKEVFRRLKDVDLKLKSKVHYVGYLVGTNGAQPLPEKFTTREALEPPQNIVELWHFQGLIWLYRKFIPFFADVNACLNATLRKGQCLSRPNNAIMHLTC